MLLLQLLSAAPLGAASSTPIALSPDGSAVWVVNPDSDTVAKIDVASRMLVGEFSVGRYPRGVAVTRTRVYVTNQLADTVTSLDVDGGNAHSTPLGFGCAPYGLATSDDGASVFVSCQGTSQLVVLDEDLTIRRFIPLPWPEARALATGPGAVLYVTHYITKEPNHAGHVS